VRRHAGAPTHDFMSPPHACSPRCRLLHVAGDGIQSLSGPKALFLERQRRGGSAFFCPEPLKPSLGRLQGHSGLGRMQQQDDASPCRAAAARFAAQSNGRTPDGLDRTPQPAPHVRNGSRRSGLRTRRGAGRKRRLLGCRTAIGRGSERASACAGHLRPGTHVATAPVEQVPASARTEATRTLLNWVGCAVGGSPQGAPRHAVAALEPFSGPARASCSDARNGWTHRTRHWSTVSAPTCSTTTTPT